MKTAFVFPGQGSQKVGMLQDLYNAYDIVKQRFAEADEALATPLRSFALKVLIPNWLKRLTHNRLF